tara:strand:- start:1359 stop:1532 length:174 start_codon:yes stop_codon:yes gene_type:complete
MSYCRFQNTLGDLEDILASLQEGHITLSPSEFEAATRLMEVATEVLEYEPDILCEDD